MPRLSFNKLIKLSQVTFFCMACKKETKDYELDSDLERINEYLTVFCHGKRQRFGPSFLKEICDDPREVPVFDE